MARQPIDWDKSFKDKAPESSQTPEYNSKFAKSLRDLIGDKLYKPKKANSGDTVKIIRFLPAALNENTFRAFVAYHELQDPQDPKKFNNVLCYNYSNNLKNSEHCEVCKKYFKALKSNDTYTLSGMKLTFKRVYNILVVNDPEEPTNNGKNFLYEASKFLDDKIFSYGKPSDPTEDSEDVMDYKTGRNVKLVLRLSSFPNKKTGKPIPKLEDNMSEFKDKSPIGLGKVPFTDKELDELDQKIYSLETIFSKENFPTKEQQITSLKYVFGEEDVEQPSSSKSYVESIKIAPPKNKEVDVSSVPEFPDDEYDFSSFGDPN